MPEFVREYLVRLPLPIARTYHRSINAKDARGRHDNTFYLFEAFIKLTAATLAAGYLHRGAVRDSRAYRPWIGCWRSQRCHRSANGFAFFVICRALLRRASRCGLTSAGSPLEPTSNSASRFAGSRGSVSAIKSNGPGRRAGSRSELFHHAAHRCFRSVSQWRFRAWREWIESFYESEMGPLLFPAANEVLAEGMLNMLGPRGTRLTYINEVRTVNEQRMEIGLSELVGREAERMAPLIVGRDEGAALVPNCVAVLWPGPRGAFESRSAASIPRLPN